MELSAEFIRVLCWSDGNWSLSLSLSLPLCLEFASMGLTLILFVYMWMHTGMRVYMDIWGLVFSCIVLHLIEGLRYPSEPGTYPFG